MASLAELLSEIRQLLATLSDRFEDLTEKVSSLEHSRLDSDAVESSYPPSEGPDPVDDTEDTRALEPPPPDELARAMEEGAGTFDADEPKTSEMEAVSDEIDTAETARMEKGETPLSPPPSKQGALLLLEKLARLQEIVNKKGLEVSPKDMAFIPKSTKVYASLPEEERVGSKGARIVLDCINFLDTISYKYIGDYYLPLQDATAALTRSLSEFLRREVGYRVFPLDEKSRAEIEDAVPDYAAATQEKLAYSAEPPGTIVAIRRRGAVLDGNIVRKAQILVSCGEQTEIGIILEAGLKEIVSLKAGSERAAELKLKAMSSLAEWHEKLHGSSDDHAMTVARYALNLLHVLESPVGAESEMFKGQTRKLKKVNDRIISLLRSGGLSEILISVGGMFDESYDPSKYERKKVASDKPEGTIVGIMRRGFLDKNGIPIQKAVVAVSGK